MLINRSYIIISAIILISACAISRPMTVAYFNSMITSIDPQVEKACTDYLNSKGFSGIAFKAVAKDMWIIGSSNTYAFTMPTRHPGTIFMSWHMEDSIKQNLDNQQPISIYDRFTLLHELGHLHPLYPYEQEFRQVARMSLLAALGIWPSLAGLAFAAVNNNKIIKIGSMGMLFASVGSLAASIYFYNTKIFSIKQRFKKLTFSHADKEFEKHIKNACEEQDADNFSITHLSVEELKELYAYFSAFNNELIVEDENAYHPTIDEECLAIIAELEKRKI